MERSILFRMNFAESWWPNVRPNGSDVIGSLPLPAAGISRRQMVGQDIVGEDCVSPVVDAGNVQSRHGTVGFTRYQGSSAPFSLRRLDIRAETLA